MAVNLKTKLQKVRTRDADFALQSVYQLWTEDDLHRTEIAGRLAQASTDANHFNFDKLDADRIFHIRHIRKICIDYRLRFLDSALFRQGIPAEALTRIRELEQNHDIKLLGFKIAAPAKAFSLGNYNDPLLFASMGNDYYYLVHQWGNDLSAMRKWLVLPIRNLGWFTLFCLLLTALVCLAIPTSRLSQRIPMAGTIVFLFAFKSLFFVLMWGFFMTGRQFNAQAWNSKYFNA